VVADRDFVNVTTLALRMQHKGQKDISLPIKFQFIQYKNNKGTVEAKTQLLQCWLQDERESQSMRPRFKGVMN